MTSLAVWVDHKEAKIYRFEVGGVSKEAIHAVHHLHHTSKDEAKKHDSSQLFHDLAGHLKDATEILVLGPGIAKTQFVHHLESHHHKDVFAKVVGTESCDHPTENQVMAQARKFFTARHALS